MLKTKPILSNDAKLQSITSLLIDSGRHLLLKLKDYLKSILIIILTLLASTLFIKLLSLVLYSYLTTQDLKTTTLITFNLLLNFLAYITLFIVLVFGNGLLVTVAIKNQPLKKSIQRIRKNFKNFLSLSIIVATLSLIVISPIFAIELMLLSGFENSIIFTFLLLISIALFIILSLWFLLTPYFMLDKGLTLKQTLQTTFKKIRKYEHLIFLRIIALYILLLIIQILVVMVTPIPILGILTNLFFIFLVTPYVYSYLAVIYEKIK